MKDSTFWLKTFECPDCHHPIHSAGSDPDTRRCSHCMRLFKRIDGIWDLLPVSVSNKMLKDREKDGWFQKEHQSKLKGWDPPPEHYLALPNHPHPYYQAAAWYMRIVLAHGAPWSGKKVLELGAAECWGCRVFAEQGADAAALDYDPTRMKKGQILLDRLPIGFSRLTGDAENLPIADDSLDVVYCCSVLHHFFDLPRAIAEIARVLKPGGIFYGIHEAYHPPYYKSDKIRAMSEDTIPNIELGINESSYPLSQYRRWFRKTGMRFDALHPRWDTKVDGDTLTVNPGIGIYHNSDFRPVSLTARTSIPGTVGRLARLILRSHLWKIAVHPSIFPLIRFHILNWTVKDKIIVAKKPNESI